MGRSGGDIPERRRCGHCGGRIGWKKRSDSAYCRPACKTAAWRVRRIAPFPPPTSREGVATFDDALWVLEPLGASLDWVRWPDADQRCVMCARPVDAAYLVIHPAGPAGARDDGPYCGDDCLLDELYKAPSPTDFRF